MDAVRLERAGLLIGAGLLVWGFATTGILAVRPVPSSIYILLFLAAAMVAVGIVATSAPRRARLIFALLFLVMTVLGFGWGPTGLFLAAGLSFSTIGEAILPGRTGTASDLGLRAALGAALAVLLLSLLVHLPVNGPVLYGFLLAVPPLTLASARKRIVGSLVRWIDARPSGGQEIAACCLLFGIVALHAVHAALPERYADALATHLYAGQQLAELGFWTFDFKDYVWAVQPMGVDWLFALGTMLAGERGAKAIALLLFLLLLATLYGSCSKARVGTVGSLILTALFASAPVAVIETTSLFVENGLTLFLLSAFLVLAQEEAPVERRASACLLLAAAAMNCKFHGVIIGAPMALGAMWLLMRERRFARLAVGVVVLAAGVSPYAYAGWVTGNPVFPFMNGIFLSPYFRSANFVDARWSQPPPWDLFFNMTFHTERYVEGWAGAFGFQIVGLSVATLCAAVTTRSRLAFATLAFMVVYIGLVCSQTTYMRYLYPVLALLTVATTPLMRGLNRPAVTAMTILLIALNLYHFDRSGWIMRNVETSALFSETRWQAEGDRVVPQRALMRRVNQDGLPRPRVLFFNESVGAGLEGKALYVSWYDQTLLDEMGKVRSAADFQRLVRAYGAGYAIIDFTRADTAYLLPFLAESGKLMDHRGSWLLYRLAPDAWLGPNLLGASGESGSWTVNGIRPGMLYRIDSTLNCPAAGNGAVTKVTFLSEQGTWLTHIEPTTVCGGPGGVKQSTDIVAPRGAAAILLEAAGPALSDSNVVTLREGYLTTEPGLAGRWLH